MALRTIWICVLIVRLSWMGATVIGQEDDVILALEVEGIQQVQLAESDEVVPVAELPDEAKVILDRLESQAKEIRRKAEEEIKVKRDAVIQNLQTLQDRYTREAKLDEAVAIRDKLRILRFVHLNPRRNPGNLSRYGNKTGETFYFDVVGSRQGAVWGTEIYTYDSSLGAAAVHAGVLKAGQRGIVKVKIIEALDQYNGSEKNGITTNNFGWFQGSYTVERPLPTDVDTHDIDSNDEPLEEPARGVRRVFLNGFEFIR